MLRAAVVFLHGTIEEVFRNLIRWKLPDAEQSALDKIPLIGFGAGQQAQKFLLGSLVEFRGEFVDNVIWRSIEQFTQGMTINKPEDITTAMSLIGSDIEPLRKHFNELNKMFKRRHQIVHQADRESEDGSGHHVAQGLSIKQVNIWIETIEDLVAILLDDEKEE